jgi:nucleotide-binding universal stress UspA family protein
MTLPATPSKKEDTMFKRILVAIDGSLASAAGFKAALDLAVDQQATLAAVHVIDDTMPQSTFEDVVYPKSYLDTYLATSEKYGRKLMDHAAGSARGSDVKFEPAVLRAQGHSVAEVIVTQARKQKVDIIVLGTHGRRGLKRVLMGSDAEEVVRSSPVPVLLVRGTYGSARKPQGAGAEKRKTARSTERAALVTAPA